MKHSDEDLTDELRKIRNDYISRRWSQLHTLSSDSGDEAIKYLFTTNAGGSVAVLAYLGSISENGASPLSAKIALLLFFVGLIFIGLYKAYMVHSHVGLFKHYQNISNEYYKGEIGWGALTKSDDTKVGDPLAPYILGYISFICFIAGSITGAYGVL